MRVVMLIVAVAGAVCLAVRILPPEMTAATTAALAVTAVSLGLAWCACFLQNMMDRDPFRWEMVKRFAIAAILLWQVTVWVRWILASVGLGGAS
jgi:hypothetical protein